MKFSIKHTDYIPQEDEIYVSHLLESEQNYVYANMGESHKIAINSDSLNKKIKSSGFLLAKTITGKIVGILDYNDVSSNKDGSYIGHNIIIHRNYRGNGIGKALLQRYMDIMEDVSIFPEDVYLAAFIHKENEPSMNLHQIFGYKIMDEAKKGNKATFYGKSYR